MKKVSLASAFSFGLHSVMQNFGFFALTTFLGALCVAVFLGFVDALSLGSLHGDMLSKFSGLVHGAHEAMHNALGVFYYGQYNIHHFLETHLPVALAKHFVTSQQVSMDLSAVSSEDIFFYASRGLVLKAVLDLVAIGWASVGFATHDKKSIAYEDALMQWHLLPNYMLTNILVWIVLVLSLLVYGTAVAALSPIVGGYAMLLSSVLLLPIVYVYQRLRLAPLFVVDKNKSAVQAVLASWKATDGHAICLFEFNFGLLLIRALASMTVVLAFFVYPFGSQADVALYKQLSR